MMLPGFGFKTRAIIPEIIPFYGSIQKKLGRNCEKTQNREYFECNNSKEALTPAK